MQQSRASHGGAVGCRNGRLVVANGSRARSPSVDPKYASRLAATDSAGSGALRRQLLLGIRTSAQASHSLSEHIPSREVHTHALDSYDALSHRLLSSAALVAVIMDPTQGSIRRHR